jgi:hypothetical protein
MPPKDFGKILDSIYGPGAGKGAEEVYQQISGYGNLPCHVFKRDGDSLAKADCENGPFGSMGGTTQSCVLKLKLT